MPTDETRRLLKMFGVAVTAYEDAVHNKTGAEALQRAEAQVRELLQEVAALIDRLRDAAASSR